MKRHEQPTASTQHAFDKAFESRDGWRRRNIFNNDILPQRLTTASAAKSAKSASLLRSPIYHRPSLDDNVSSRSLQLQLNGRPRVDVLNVADALLPKRAVTSLSPRFRYVDLRREINRGWTKKWSASFVFRVSGGSQVAAFLLYGFVFMR